MNDDGALTMQLINAPEMPMDGSTWVDCEISCGGKKLKAQLRTDKLKFGTLTNIGAFEFNTTIEVNFRVQVL